MQTVQDRVVADVDDGRDGPRRDHTDQSGEQPSSTNTAAEGDEHGASIEGGPEGPIGVIAAPCFATICGPMSVASVFPSRVVRWAVCKAPSVPHAANACAAA